MKKIYLFFFLLGHLTIHAQTEAGISVALSKEKGTTLFSAGENISKYSAYVDKITMDALPDFIEALESFNYYTAKTSRLSSDKAFGSPIQKIYFVVFDEMIHHMYIILKKGDAEKLRNPLMTKFGDPEYILDPITSEPASRYVWWSPDYKTNLVFYFGPNFETGEGEGAYMLVFSKEVV